METFREYQNKSLESMNNDLGQKEKILMCCLGLSGESGEVNDHIKKWLYHGHELDRQKILSECGDTLWYLSQLGLAFGYTLEDISAYNITKLEKRYQGKFSSEKSINRVSE